MFSLTKLNTIRQIWEWFLNIWQCSSFSSGGPNLFKRILININFRVWCICENTKWEFIKCECGFVRIFTLPFLSKSIRKLNYSRDNYDSFANDFSRGNSFCVNLLFPKSNSRAFLSILLSFLMLSQSKNELVRQLHGEK